MLCTLFENYSEQSLKISTPLRFAWYKCDSRIIDNDRTKAMELFVQASAILFLAFPLLEQDTISGVPINKSSVTNNQNPMKSSLTIPRSETSNVFASYKSASKTTRH